MRPVRFAMLVCGLAVLGSACAPAALPTADPAVVLETAVAQALQATAQAASPTPKSTATPRPTSTPAATRTPRPTVPTRTPRPTSTPDYGTAASNPFPFGYEVSLTRSENGNEVTDWTLQVLEVIRGEEADRLVHRANQFNDPPPAGTSWMFVKVKVTLVSGQVLTFDDSDAAILSGGQLFVGFDFSACCTDDVGYPEIDAKIAAPGYSSEGWIIRPVMLDDEKPLLVLNVDMFNPSIEDGLFFALTQ